MRVDDLLHDVQAQAQPLARSSRRVGLDSIERLEQHRDHVLRDGRPVIVDLDQHIRGLLAQRDAHGALRRTVLEPVADQVRGQLGHAIGVPVSQASRLGREDQGAILVHRLELLDDLTPDVS